MLSTHRFTFSGIILVLTLAFTGCSSIKLDSKDIEMKYVKSKARSMNEPDFTIELKGDSVYYNGIANVDYLGKTIYIIDNKTLIKIKEAFNKAQFSEMKDSYIGRYRDIPRITITYNDKAVTFQVKEATSKLINLMTIIESYLLPK